MTKILETEEFSDWLEDLPDSTARTKISARVQRLAHGNPGDVKSIGKGISELRIHHGPGYRVYFQRKGNVLIVLLCGGDKSSQRKDIERAIRLAAKRKD